METDLPAEIQGSSGLQLLTFSQEHAPGRSAASITVEIPEDFPPAGGRALEVALVAVVVFTAGAVDAVVDDIGDCMRPHVEFAENSRMGKTSCRREI